MARHLAAHHQQQQQQRMVHTTAKDFMTMSTEDAAHSRRMLSSNNEVDPSGRTAANIAHPTDDTDQGESDLESPN